MPMLEAAKEAKRQYLRDWRKKNRQHALDYMRTWRAENKEKLDIYQNRYWNKKAAEQARG